MRLDKHEVMSAVWLKLEAHLNERLSALRTNNDGDLTPEQTAKTRGRIAFAKEILALAEQREQVQEGD
jgi:hypothetical protein